MRPGTPANREGSGACVPQRMGESRGQVAFLLGGGQDRSVRMGPPGGAHPGKHRPGPPSGLRLLSEGTAVFPACLYPASSLVCVGGAQCAITRTP